MCEGEILTDYGISIAKSEDVEWVRLLVGASNIENLRQSRED